MSESYAAARVLDAFRHLPEDASPFAWIGSGVWSECANSYTLSSHRSSVENVSFFTDISDVRDDFTSLLSKVLNSRCQARKYGTVAEKKLLSKPAELEHWARASNRSRLAEKGPCTRDVKIARDRSTKLHLSGTVIRIVLCSLLGNYPHCTTRLRSRARKVMYDLLYYGTGNTVDHLIPARTFGFFQSMLHLCPVIVKWCLRDYLIAEVIDNPGLRSQVETAIRLDDFRRITEEAMTAMRAYIDFQLDHPWTPLSKALEQPVPGEPVFCLCLQPKRMRPRGGCLYSLHHGAWLHDMNVLLAPFHDTMLQHKYHKPDTGVIGFLLGKEVRTNHAPLVPLPNAADASVDFDPLAAADAEGAGEMLVEDIVLGNLQGVAVASHHAFREAQRRHQYEQDQRSRDKEATTRFLRYLTPEQFGELSWLVENTQSELHTLVESWFEFFGVDRSVIDKIHTLLAAHRDGSITKHARLRLTQELQRCHAHAYNLLQISAELMRMNLQTRPRIIGKLPLATIQAQIRAAEAKWGTKTDIEESSLCLFYCGVCGEIYSHVQDEGSSVHYKYYRFGLGNVWRDYETGEVYCSRNKINHRGACDSTPLKRVNLLGIRFAYQKRVYQLCVECCAIMVPGKSGKDNGKGDLCRACSSVIEDVVTQPIEEFKKTLVSKQCCCCSRSCKTEASTYLLVFGLVVCRHCWKRGVSFRFDKDKPPTVEAAKALAVHWYVERKKKEHTRLVRLQKPQMARQKQRDRGRKA